MLGRRRKGPRELSEVHCRPAYAGSRHRPARRYCALDPRASERHRLLLEPTAAGRAERLRRKNAISPLNPHAARGSCPRVADIPGRRPDGMPRPAPGPGRAGQTDTGGGPLAAGSTTDIVPRVVFDHLSARLGQPSSSTTGPGAGATIGTAPGRPLGARRLHAAGPIVGATSLPPLSCIRGLTVRYLTRDFAGVISDRRFRPPWLVVAPARGFKTPSATSSPQQKRNPGRLQLLLRRASVRRDASQRGAVSS